MLKNADANPRNLNRADTQNMMVFRLVIRSMNLQVSEDGNPQRKNPEPSAGTQDYGASPNFRPSQGEVPYNAKEEIAALRQQVQDSQNQQNQLKMELVAANKRAALYQSRLDRLQIHCNTCETNAAITIADLTKQLEEARGNKPQNNRATAVVTDQGPITDRLEDMSPNMEEQRNVKEEIAALRQQLQDSQNQLVAANKRASLYQSRLDRLRIDLKKQLEEARGNKPQDNNDTAVVTDKSPNPAAELCVEPSTQSTEVSHTDTSAKDVSVCEVLCKTQQQQIEQLQQQLLQTQGQLEEQAAQLRQEQDREEKELLQQTVRSLQESLQKSVQEDQVKDQSNEEKEDSLLQNIKSLQESLQRSKEKENIVIAKMDKLDSQTNTELEKKKKKSFRWLCRLFS